VAKICDLKMSTERKKVVLFTFVLLGLILLLNSVAVLPFLDVAILITAIIVYAHFLKGSHGPLLALFMFSPLEKVAIGLDFGSMQVGLKIVYVAVFYVSLLFLYQRTSRIGAAQTSGESRDIRHVVELLLLFVLSSVVTSFATLETTYIRKSFFYLFLMFVFLLAYHYSRRDPQFIFLRRMFFLTSIPTIVYSLIQIAQIMSGRIPASKVLAAISGQPDLISQTWVSREFGFRVNGLFIDASMLGEYLVVMILSVALLRRISKRISAADSMAFILLLTLILMSTLERVSFVGLALALLILLAYSKKRIRFLFFWGPIFFLAGISPLGKKTILRVFSVEAGSSDASRLYYMADGVRMFLAHPFFGSGVDSYKDLFFSYDPSRIYLFPAAYPHSLPIQILVEGGLFSLVFYALFWGAFLRLNRSLRHRVKSLLEARVLDFIWATSLVVLVMNMVNGLFYQEFIFALLGIQLGYMAVIDGRLREAINV